MLVRDFRSGDEAALQGVFYSAIHSLAAKDYTPEQIAAWAPAQPDLDRWTARMRGIRPFVVEESGRIVGYADLQSDGYIDHFFVSGDRARRGVGRVLMNRIHERAKELGLGALFSDVSRTAQPFFERFGFHVLEHRVVVIGGVQLANARMTKTLSAPSGGTG
jgi:putative acetyltransferase